MSRRTSAYRFTVQSLDDSRIDQLRKDAKLLNLGQRMGEVAGYVTPNEYYGNRAHKRFRVVVRGRLGKNSPHRDLYRRGGALYRFSAQTIRPEHSSRFDVYLQEYTRWSKVK